jgi:murein DD-endopeptidase MepM/ murein hydrolase activator NlpD
VRRFLPLAILLAALLLASGCSYYHVVEPGDTLYDMSKDYGVSVQEIQTSNPGIDPYNLQIGQRVKVPRFPNQRVSDYSKDRADAKPTPRPAVEPTPRPRPKPKPKPVPRVKPDPPRSTATVTAEQPQFIWPVQGGMVTSRFGQLVDGAESHGVEIAVGEGAPVLAAAAGKVILASSEFKGYGNMVVVRHDNNFFTIYSYNKRSFVKKGQQVTQGQKIAEVGQTGRATKPELHFQVRIGAKAVDPLKYLPKR